MTPKVFAPSAVDVVKKMFCNYLEDAAREGTQFTANETLQFGWSWLLVNEVNSVLEVNAPKPGEMPMQFVSDCSASLNLMMKQRYICDSFKQSIEPCNARQSAIVVNDLASCKNIFMNRTESEHDGVSGWFIGAKDSKANSKNANDLELKSLWEISCLHPKTLDFFFLPVNWQVLFTEQPIVLNDFRPAECLENSYFATKYMS